MQVLLGLVQVEVLQLGLEDVVARPCLKPWMFLGGTKMDTNHAMNPSRPQIEELLHGQTAGADGRSSPWHRGGTEVELLPATTPSSFSSDHSFDHLLLLATTSLSCC